MARTCPHNWVGIRPIPCPMCQHDAILLLKDELKQKKRERSFVIKAYKFQALQIENLQKTLEATRKLLTAEKEHGRRIAVLYADAMHQLRKGE